MERIKKLLSVLLVAIMVFTMFGMGMTVSAENVSTETSGTNDSPLKVEVITDKSSYGTFGVAEITVKVTNTSDDTVENISVETIFDDLAPVGRKSETSKEVESLNAGESFSFSYKATLNMNNSNLSFFERFILWFVRLFNGGFTATENNFNNGRKCDETIKSFYFGNTLIDVCVNSWYQINTENLKNEELDKIQQINNGNLPKIIYSDYKNLEWISGNYYDNQVKNEDDAIHSLSSIKNLLNITNSFEWKCSYQATHLNHTYYRLQQYFKGYKIKGAEWIISVDNNNDYTISSANGNVVPCYYLDSTCNINLDEAKRIVEKDFGNTAKISEEIEMVFIKENSDSLNHHLAYEIYVNGKKTPEVYYVSALNGQILYQTDFLSNDRVSATGIDNTNTTRNFYCEKVENDLYYLADFDKNISIYDAGNKDVSWTYNSNNNTWDVYWNNVWYEVDSWFTKAEVVQSNENKWTNKNAVTLMANLCVAYDYYQKNIGIRGYNNNNGEVFAIINDNIKSDRTNAYSLAFPNVNTTIISFGVDNNISLGTVAHEYTHSVMNSIIYLDDNGESGALREAYADILGEIIENDTTWTHGDRVISNPSVNNYPDYYMGNNWGDTSSSFDDGYVHQNSTVVSHAAYLMSKKGIDNKTLAKIWYKSIFKLDENSDFRNCREAVIETSKELNLSENKKEIIIEAFNEVGIYPIYNADTTVYGTVKDKTTNNAVHKVKVSFKLDDDTILFNTYTDENGGFKTYLPKGDYLVSFYHDNYEYYGITVNVDSDNVVLKNPILLTRKSGNLSATIKDSTTGNAISGVTVEIIDNESDDLTLITTVTTDSNGLFSVKLPYGSYSLSFNHDNYEYYGMTVNVDTENIVLTEPVLLTPKNSSGGGSEDDRTIIDSGSCGADGDNATWTLYDDGELVISGTGNMKDYYYNKVPWRSLETTKITITDGITSIGENNICGKLKEVMIPKTVTALSSSSFYETKSLTKIIVDKDNKHYSNDDYGVLYNKNQTKLIQYPIGNPRKSFTIPNSVTTIGEKAFAYCSNLTNIIIPNSVKSSGANVFLGCTGLTSVLIPSSWKNIALGSFGFCDSLTNVIISNGVTSIGQNAFMGCGNLNNISIPNSVTSIGVSAFQFCENLTTIIIPNNVTKIGQYAFSHCYNLTNISIPNGIESINYCAFAYCEKLTNVYYAGNEEDWNNINITSGDNGNDCLISATIHYNS